jgi:hypothetical protein
MISETVVEIRIRPDPRLLDYRGDFAESMTRSMNLVHWQVDTSRVDAFDEHQSMRCFVSFQNLGLILRNSQPRDYFPNQSGKFLKNVLTQKPFEESTFVERIGVRSRFAIPSLESFHNLLEKYMKNYTNISSGAANAFSGRIIDVGMPINFQTEIGKINSSSGIMQKDQFSQFFQLEKQDDLPEIAIYLDFDYFETPKRLMVYQDVIARVKEYAFSNWDLREKITDLILGNNNDD